MDLGSLFLHNAVDERDRAEYLGEWTEEDKKKVEDAFDVLVNDPDFKWRHNNPRVPKKVDGGYNHFILINQQYSRLGIKRFTWSNFKYLSSIEEVVKYIEYLYQPLNSRKTWEEYLEN